MAPEAQGTKQRNRILNRLSISDFAILEPHLRSVHLRFQQRLQSRNKKIADVYFPESGIACVLAISGGRQAEVGTLGCEGMTGLPLVLGTDRSPFDIVVQIEGDAQCISADAFRGAVDQSVTMIRLFLKVVHVSAVQSSYAALAHGKGNVEERLARWLLMAHDRVEGGTLALTHEHLATLLGTRRAGVSTALGHLESKGLVKTGRRAVTVKDRAGLEECANGFYGAPEAEFRRVFGVKR